jgi:hypothetical protein
MTVEELHSHLSGLIAEGHGHLRVVLTDTAPDGTGAVYEPTDVDLLLGDDGDDWVGVDLRAADLSEVGES